MCIIAELINTYNSKSKLLKYINSIYNEKYIYKEYDKCDM